MTLQRTTIKRLLVLVILVSVGALTWSFVAFRSNRSALEEMVPKMATKAVMSLSNVSQTATKDGAVQWKLEADTAQYEAESNRMLLTAPRVEFFMEDGTKVLLTASSGVLNTNSNDMHVEGNVALRNGQYTLVTEALTYTHQRRTLKADQPVEIVGEAIALNAADMTYDLNTNQARFGGRVKGTLNDNFAL